MSTILDIVTSKNLTYEQKVHSLAHAAEDTLTVLHIPEKTRYYLEQGAICDMYEGAAPYRPRYVMPDYEKYVQNGSEFLGVAPPEDLDELLQSLMVLYHHVPSITGFPVYLGNLDRLIEPFIEDMQEDQVKKKLKLFLNFLDRTITDSFCHANLGPEATRAGKILLELEKELQNAVPNITLKYDPAVTPDDFAQLALHTSLHCANPAMCNHQANRQTYPVDYGISSCYNILPIGGGAHTLTRLTLPHLAKLARDQEHFFQELLPECLEAMGAYMNERIRFLVEESGFFQSSFLVEEGLVDPGQFVGMFGVTGLAEGTNILLQEQGYQYGRDPQADDLAARIMEAVQTFAEQFPAVYSDIAKGHFMLHAQVGLDSDLGVTSGVRIPVGHEPEEFYDHLRHTARFHRYITTGCGDIFAMESATKNNLAAMLDIVKGAFLEGVKYMSFYEKDSDLVRITGYLVKRSEMEKWSQNKAVLQNTTQLGEPNYKHNRLANRKVRGA